MKVVCAAIGLAAVLGLCACAPAKSPVGAAVTFTAGPTAGAASPHSSRAASTGASAPVASPGASPAAAPVTITAVGDTMLGNTPDLPPDPATYFDAVKHILDPGAQIVFGNLEGTLTTAPTSKCSPRDTREGNCFAFRDPPGYVRYLKQAGFTILNDANNHSYDFGAAGQAQTVRVIHAAGLAQTGLPGEITLVTANGIKFAFLAFAPYAYDANLLDLPAARALIKQAGREADVVVVYMHAGAEGSDADHVTGQ